MRSKALGSTDWHRNTKRIRTSFITLQKDPEFVKALNSLRNKYFPDFAWHQKLQADVLKITDQLLKLFKLSKRKLFGEISHTELFRIVSKVVAIRSNPPPASLAPLSPFVESCRVCDEIVKELRLPYKPLIEKLIALEIEMDKLESTVKVPRQVLARFAQKFRFRPEDASCLLIRDSPYVLTYARKKFSGTSVKRRWWRSRWTEGADGVENRNLFIVQLKRDNPKLNDKQIVSECFNEGYDVEPHTVRKVLSRARKQTRC